MRETKGKNSNLSYIILILNELCKINPKLKNLAL